MYLQKKLTKPPARARKTVALKRARKRPGASGEHVKKKRRARAGTKALR